MLLLSDSVTICSGQLLILNILVSAMYQLMCGILCVLCNLCVGGAAGWVNVRCERIIMNACMSRYIPDKVNRMPRANMA